eukprot:1050246-Pelagomonas_calceolata.AAC.5
MRVLLKLQPFDHAKGNGPIQPQSLLCTPAVFTCASCLKLALQFSYATSHKPGIPARKGNPLALPASALEHLPAMWCAPCVADLLPSICMQPFHFSSKPYVRNSVCHPTGAGLQNSGCCTGLIEKGPYCPCENSYGLTPKSFQQAYTNHWSSACSSLNLFDLRTEMWGFNHVCMRRSPTYINKTACPGVGAESGMHSTYTTSLVYYATVCTKGQLSPNSTHTSHKTAGTTLDYIYASGTQKYASWYVQQTLVPLLRDALQQILHAPYVLHACLSVGHTWRRGCSETAGLAGAEPLCTWM